MADFRGKHVCDAFGCDKVFAKESRLIIHMRSHTGERPYECKVMGCGSSYKRVDHLRRHERSAHQTNTSEVKDEEIASGSNVDCNTSVSSLDGDRKPVNKYKKLVHKCEVDGCNAEFKKRTQLNQHSCHAHSEICQNRCLHEGCGKSFLTPDNLKRHMKTHAGYPCSEPGCSAVFDKWSLFCKHRKVEHLSKRVFKCDMCQKVFKQKQWLRQHMLTHESTRTALVCSYEGCQREYLDQRNLNAHIRIHHEGQRFNCEHEDCDRSFSSKRRHDLHQKLHDPNRPLPKKKPKKKLEAARALKLSGSSLVSESRGHDVMTFTSPNREDSIDLDLDDLQSLTNSNIDSSIHSSDSSDDSDPDSGIMKSMSSCSSVSVSPDVHRISGNSSIQDNSSASSTTSCRLRKSVSSGSLQRSEDSRGVLEETFETPEEMLDSIYQQTVKEISVKHRSKVKEISVNQSSKMESVINEDNDDCSTDDYEIEMSVT